MTSSISYKKLVPVDCISCFQNPMGERSPEQRKLFGRNYWWKTLLFALIIYLISIEQSPKLFDYSPLALHLLDLLSAESSGHDLHYLITHGQRSTYIYRSLFAVTQFFEFFFLLFEYILNVDFLNSLKYTFSLSLEKARCNLLITPWSFQAKISSL